MFWWPQVIICEPNLIRCSLHKQVAEFSGVEFDHHKIQTANQQKTVLFCISKEWDSNRWQCSHFIKRLIGNEQTTSHLDSLLQYPSWTSSSTCAPRYLLCPINSDRVRAIEWMVPLSISDPSHHSTPITYTPKASFWGRHFLQISPQNEVETS